MKINWDFAKDILKEEYYDDCRDLWTSLNYDNKKFIQALEEVRMCCMLYGISKQKIGYVQTRLF